MIRKIYFSILCMTLGAALAFPQGQSASNEGTAKPDPKEVKKLEEQAARLDNEARHADGSDRVFESLSKELGVPVETLKTQQQGTNFGFGQLFIANALAKQSGKTFDQMAQEFKSGKGWGQIAKENNVKLGKIVSDMKHSTAEMRKNHKEEMRARNNENKGKPQGVGRPESTGRPKGAGRPKPNE